MRELDWEGCWNVRDLGGLPTHDGATTRFGAFVRSAKLSRVTPTGWDAALRHGVRSIVDVRSSDERERDPTNPPGEVRVVAVPLEEGLMDDPRFSEWAQTGLLSTPEYYLPYLHHWGDRCRPVFEALASQPGVVLFHCSAGTDRTGMLSAMLLQLADVLPAHIVDDYMLSRHNVQGERARSLDVHDPTAVLDEVLERLGHSQRSSFEAFLGALHARELLTSIGVEGVVLDTLRTRMRPAP